MMFGDFILIVSILVALYYVPRYLWRVYGGPDIGAWIVKTFRAAIPRLETPPRTDQTDRRAGRLSVSAMIEHPPRWQLDKTRTAIIEELLYSGWTMTDFRREQIFRGDNNKISAEVEAARQRLGIESADPRTPIASRPTSAKFADAPLD